MRTTSPRPWPICRRRSPVDLPAARHRPERRPQRELRCLAARGSGYLSGLDPAVRGVPRLVLQGQMALAVDKAPVQGGDLVSAQRHHRSSDGCGHRCVPVVLDTPWLRAPAGSVAIAGALAAVCPSAARGGRRLLRRTSALLWDPRRDSPALLAPGMRVRFRPVRQLPETTCRGIRARRHHLARPAPRPASPAPLPASPSPRPASPSPRPASPSPRPASPSPLPASPSPRPASQ
jgi:hypothetical protein